MLKFGTKSKRELVGVHPHMIIVSTTALCTMPSGYDFTVFDGLRTKQEQQENIDNGVSWTMNSYHLPQHDGYAWAVDLVPIVDGRLSWDDKKNKNRQQKITDCFNFITDRMFSASALHSIPILHGFQLWGKDWPHFHLDPKIYGE